jgi:hypothetical protein
MVNALAGGPAAEAGVAIGRSGLSLLGSAESPSSPQPTWWGIDMTKGLVVEGCG